MFDKFGEFNSWEEINQKAEDLLNEGKMDLLEEMAEENGIDKEFVSMYASGDIPGICDPMTAALGKIEVEAKAIGLTGWGILEDWTEYLKALVAEEETIAKGVRKRGKTLCGAIAELLKWSSKNRKQLPKEICKAAGVPENVYMGTPGMQKAKELIQKYYEA